MEITDIRELEEKLRRKTITIDELKKLKIMWYNDNQVAIEKCYTIGRILGESINDKYGPKYKYTDRKNDLVIYVNDHGNYMNVRFKNKEVCSTHPCSKKFIPDKKWVSIIEEIFVEAKRIKSISENEINEKERLKMMDELTI